MLFYRTNNFIKEIGKCHCTATIFVTIQNCTCPAPRDSTICNKLCRRQNLRWISKNSNLIFNHPPSHTLGENRSVNSKKKNNNVRHTQIRIYFVNFDSHFTAKMAEKISFFPIKFFVQNLQSCWIYPDHVSSYNHKGEVIHG